MARFFVILCCFCLILLGGYFAFSRWAIRHETVALFDITRDRTISLEITVLRDSESRAYTGLVKLPVAVVSQGNTVKNTESSFLANFLAARGYLVVSIQYDLPTDVPLITTPGALYAGKNHFLCQQRIEENPAERRLWTPDDGWSFQRREISMFFAQQHPDLVKMIVTLDNLGSHV